MPNDFGSPERKDKTAEIESGAQKAAERLRQRMDEVLSLYQRPGGTVYVPLKDRQFDYDNRGQDYWPKKFTEAVAELRPGQNKFDVIAALLDHESEMRKRDGNE